MLMPMLIFENVAPARPADHMLLLQVHSIFFSLHNRYGNPSNTTADYTHAKFKRL